jgi:MFS family permease
MGASRSEIGLILGISTTSMLFSRPLVGFALDKWGRKRILMLSLVLLSFISFAYLSAKTPIAVFIIRFLQMIPFAAAITTLTTIASDLIPNERRGEGLSIFTGGSTIALAIGPGVGITLFNGKWYGLPFLLAGILGIVSFSFSFLIKEPKFIPVDSTLSIKSLFDKRVAMIALVAAICYMGFPGLMSYSTLFAKEVGIPIVYVSYVFLVYGLSELVTRLLTAKALDKKNPKIMGVVSLVFFLLSLSIIGAWRSLLGLMLGALLLGFGSGITFPTLLLMAMDMAPHKKGVSSALLYAGLDVGTSLGALLFGVFGDLLNSYGNTYLIFAFIEVIAILCFRFVTYPYYRKEKDKMVVTQNSSI